MGTGKVMAHHVPMLQQASQSGCDFCLAWLSNKSINGGAHAIKQLGCLIAI